MSRYPALLCLTAALVVCAGEVAPAAPVPKHLMPKEEVFRFPSVVGTTWVYDVDGTGEMTLTVSKVETNKDGTVLVTCDRVANGQNAHYMTWSIGAKGIYLVAEGGNTYPVPWCIFKLPHKEGDSWKTEGHGGDMTGGPLEKKKTVVGEFNAYRVYWDLGPNRRVSYWYSPSFGLIAQEGTPNLSLKSFTKGKE